MLILKIIDILLQLPIHVFILQNQKAAHNGVYLLKSFWSWGYQNQWVALMRDVHVGNLNTLFYLSGAKITCPQFKLFALQLFCLFISGI